MRILLLASTTTAIVATSLGGAWAQSRGPYGGQPPAPAQSGPPGGSYVQSCRNIQAGGGMLTADCRNIHSQYVRSSIAYGQCRGDIADTPNGILACNGAVASGGQVVDNGGDRRGRDNDNGGQAMGGVMAGALLGGAMSANQPPPAYGDPRYGDPRYDSRYAQGGWGYGHRRGEWVAIRDRADWLERRIDRAQQDGRLNWRDARDLRRQLRFIESREADYLRDGRLGPGERADLDRRFDDLSSRIRYEAGPGGRDGDYRDRDHGYDRGYGR